jgi:hypothetical protein
MQQAGPLDINALRGSDAMCYVLLDLIANGRGDCWDANECTVAGQQPANVSEKFQGTSRCAMYMSLQKFSLAWSNK